MSKMLLNDPPKDNGALVNETLEPPEGLEGLIEDSFFKESQEPPTAPPPSPTPPALDAPSQEIEALNFNRPEVLNRQQNPWPPQQPSPWPRQQRYPLPPRQPWPPRQQPWPPRQPNPWPPRQQPMPPQQQPWPPRQQPQPQPQPEPTPPNNQDSTEGVGSLSRIWIQDPSVKGLDSKISTVYIPEGILPGPRSDDIVIAGISEVLQPDANNNYLYDPKTNPGAFDVMHVFCIVHDVLNMYRRGLQNKGVDYSLNWQWGNGPLKIYPYAGEMKNAFYDRTNQCLKFYYFYDQNTQKTVYTCQSADIVAHEAGHAILDALRPGYFESQDPQTGGLHEAFGDLTNLFYLLGNMEFCHDVYVFSKGNLHNPSFFQRLGEEFGSALGKGSSLRNADNDLTMAEVSDQVHEISQVFTGAIYDILSDYYDLTKQKGEMLPAEALYHVGEELQSLLTTAILMGPEKNARYEDIAAQMIALEPDEDKKTIIQHQFERRLVLGAKLNSAMLFHYDAQIEGGNGPQVPAVVQPEAKGLEQEEDAREQFEHIRL